MDPPVVLNGESATMPFGISAECVLGALQLNVTHMWSSGDSYTMLRTAQDSTIILMDMNVAKTVKEQTQQHECEEMGVGIYL